MLIVFMDLAMPYGIDIPRVIRNGLHPSRISNNAEGRFYTYYIKVGGTDEEVYIEYDDSGLIKRFIRKPLPKYD